MIPQGYNIGSSEMFAFTEEGVAMLSGVLRSKAAAADICEITGNANTAILHINSIKPEAVAKLSEHFGSRFSLNAASTPVYTVRMRAGQKMSDLAAELAKAL